MSRATVPSQDSPGQCKTVAMMNVNEQLTRISDLERENFNLKIELTICKEKLGVYQASDSPEEELRVRLQSKLTQTQQESASNKAKLEEQQYRMDALRQELKVLQEERRTEALQLESERQAMSHHSQSKIEELEDTNNDLRGQIGSLQTALASKVESLDPIMQELLERSGRDGQLLTEYSNKLRVEQETTAELQAKLEEAQQEIKFIDEQLVAAVNARERAEYDKSLLELQTQEQEMVANTFIERNEHLTSTVADVKARFSEFRAQAEDIAAMEAQEIARLQEAYNAKASENEHISLENQQLSRDLTETRRLLQIFSTQHLESIAEGNKVEALEKECKHLRWRNRKLADALVEAAASAQTTKSLETRPPFELAVQQLETATLQHEEAALSSTSITASPAEDRASQDAVVALSPRSLVGAAVLTSSGHVSPRGLEVRHPQSPTHLAHMSTNSSSGSHRHDAGGSHHTPSRPGNQRHGSDFKVKLTPHSVEYAERLMGMWSRKIRRASELHRKAQVASAGGAASPDPTGRGGSSVLE